MINKYLDEYINLEYSDIKEYLTTDNIESIQSSIKFKVFIVAKCLENLRCSFKKEFFSKIKNIFLK